MTTAIQNDWKKEFGLDNREPPYFISSVNQLDDIAWKIPHPHTLRRAFDELRIDGILCLEHSPVIYFRQVVYIDTNEIRDLHRSFWNQGIAPILVIIAPEEVHVYSGLIPPEDTRMEIGQAPCLIGTLKRIQNQLRSFLFSVESGEYFRDHQSFFNPNTRVDRELLRSLNAARQELGLVDTARLIPQTLEALLCRLVFTCYLFDRHIIGRDYLEAIGIIDAVDLKDILAKQPRTVAKTDLYKLFIQLGNDFNGDLFTDDLEAEGRQIKVEHLDILDCFFHGTDVQTGQQSFWPYDFSFISIETISAIYEYFLKTAGEKQKKEAGAFYTPRFLAEFVLDIALEGQPSLLDKRFLDPACGSGIFLVGLFNRLAQEWKIKNPGARYDRRANGLMDILRRNLFGVDSNRSACRITAFSLYLAFLDHLSPPDIQKLLGKWDRLPNLVCVPGETNQKSCGTIRCADFFTEDVDKIRFVDVIVGNPPWGPVKNATPTASEMWCADNKLEIPNREKSVPFIWKAPIHLNDDGIVCFLLPHGILFNHNDTAIHFQLSLFKTHAVDRVVNLTDYRFFLFEESLAPALVVKYRHDKPTDGSHLIDYWTPKTDLAVRLNEIISILPQDCSRITVREILEDLKGVDAPLIWKKRFWATPRNIQLIDRMSLYSRLRDQIRRSGAKNEKKRWVISTGLREFCSNDPESTRISYTLPTRRFISTESKHLDLILLESDCELLPSKTISLRRNLQAVDIFRVPHVLFNKGFTKAAFVDFDVVFLEAVRGIHGPESDRELLIFLSAYLCSDLARYFLFHTSSNWGVYRPEVHVEESLRLPFPLPDETNDPKRSQAIIHEIAVTVTNATKEASQVFADREEIVDRAKLSTIKLIEEYFDINETERMLITDTVRIIIPSIQPTRGKMNVPTIKQSSGVLRASYAKLLCNRLNGWAKQEYRVHCKVVADAIIGVGMVILEKTKRKEAPTQLSMNDDELLNMLDSLQRIAAKSHETFNLVRGLKVFHKNLLYITKPLGQRFWTNTAALNDADEIAATILTRPVRE